MRPVFVRAFEHVFGPGRDLRPVAEMVKLQRLLANRGAGDGVVGFIERAPSEAREAVESVVGVQLALASLAGHHILLIEAVGAFGITVFELHDVAVAVHFGVAQADDPAPGVVAVERGLVPGTGR